MIDPSPSLRLLLSVLCCLTSRQQCEEESDDEVGSELLDTEAAGVLHLHSTAQHREYRSATELCEIAVCLFCSALLCSS